MKYGSYFSVDERKALSTAEMHDREELGVSLGISKLNMMENAGSNIARFIVEKFARSDSKVRVLLLAGTGNNGGDVFVAARHLSYWTDKFEPSLILVGGEDIPAKEASDNWRILKSIPKIKILVVDSVQKINLVSEMVGRSELVAVGIFGTGFKGKPRELQNEIIRLVNSSNNIKISVDIPSGMNADTGFFETAVRSDYTITMDSPKLGMTVNESAKKICGEILVANIGLP